MISTEKLGTPEELVEHFGIKGMRWGIRKQESQAAPTYSAHGVKGLEKFPLEQGKALDFMAGKLKESYGFQVNEVMPLTNREVDKHYYAYVNLGGKSRSSVIHMSNDPDLKASLLQKEKEGWLTPSNGRVLENLITHESGHAIFHTLDAKLATQMDRVRKRAWDKAEAQALKDGDAQPRKPGLRHFFDPSPRVQMSGKLSEYARRSIFLEETEAELFSSYHWSPNPPKFVDVFMNEVHGEMGKKVEPFGGRKVNV